MIRRDRLAVRDRQRPRMTEAHRAGVGVGLGAEHVRARAEHLRRGGELDVALEPDHRLVVGHQPVPAMIGGRRSRPGRTPARAPLGSSVGSSSAGAVSWIPTGKPGIVQPAGDADGRHPREVRGDREDVVQVHRHRVVGLLADLERGRRRRRRDEHVEALEGALVVADHERAHLLRLAVVRLVVAGRQRVGAEHDPALHLGSEPLPTRREHHRDAVGVLARRTVAVADAVVAREVRRTLARGDQVVGGQGVGGVWQRDLADRGAEPLETVDRRADRGGDAGLDPLAERLGDHPDPQPFDPTLEGVGVGRDRHVQGRRIAWVVAGEHLEHRRRVAHATA